jgi:small-conductance mechanosensitive channel/CRP-like cAMP-binding protein
MAVVGLPWTDPESTFNVVSVASAAGLAVLIVLQAAVVRRRPIGLLVMLAMYLSLLGFKALATGVPALQDAFGLAALIVLLLAVARAGFVLIFLGLLHFLHRDLPKIALDIIQTLLFLLAGVLTLVAAGVEPLSLLTGSAVLTAVLGLALRDTLGNLFAGIALHAQQPFELGDWIQFDDNPSHIGKVVEINWRATTVVTLDDVSVIVPNGTLGAGRITNFTKPQLHSRRSVYVNAPSDVPPRRVHDLILAAIGDAWGVLKEPPPSVVTNLFDERGVQYWVRFWTVEYGRRDRVDGGVRDCIWYALNRAGIVIPAPQRTVALQSTAPSRAALVSPDGQREAILRKLPLFADLSDDDVHRLALLSHNRLYALNEVIIRQGDAGNEMFVVVRGRLAVSVQDAEAGKVDVADIGPGGVFGEMALLTGAPRAATVQAVEECELLAIGLDAFRQLLAASPDLAERIHTMAGDRAKNIAGQLDAASSRTGGQAAPRHFLSRFLDQLLSGGDPTKER